MPSESSERGGTEGVEASDMRTSLRLAGTPSAVSLDSGQAYSRTEDRQIHGMLPTLHLQRHSSGSVKER